MARDHHHVLSRGYLRFFSRGELIRVVDKVTEEGKERGIPVAFVERNFNTMWTAAGRLDDVEDEWGRIEDLALPAVREGLRSRDLGPVTDQLKALAAVHSARSFLVRDFFDKAFAARLADPTAGMDMELLRSTFIEQYGRQAEPGEIERIVADQTVERHKDKVLFVTEMTQVHNKILRKLWPLHLQPIHVIAPDRVPLVTGDAPVVRVSPGGVRVNVAFGDAQSIYMPLSPDMGVSFTTSPEGPVEASPYQARQLNNYVWRSARRYVACHPDADWQRALLL